jgi:hypothetical protein
MLGSVPVADTRATDQSVTVQAFGVTVEVAADARHLQAIEAILPPGGAISSQRPEHGRFALVATGDRGLMDVLVDDEPAASAVDLNVALGVLDSQIRMHIAMHAPDHVFVHAGVVGMRERAIVLPGSSFAGKTTLVAALVRAGAEYWSDEYAALDAHGLVHPYAKPLSVRNHSYVAEERTIESLGGRAGDRPLPIGLIAFAHYRRGASWTPQQCTRGAGAIKLLKHTIPARTRPEQALEAIRHAATDALVLEGDRGEADQTAAALLVALETEFRNRTE